MSSNTSSNRIDRVFVAWLIVNLALGLMNTASYLALGQHWWSAVGAGGGLGTAAAYANSMRHGFHRVF